MKINGQFVQKMVNSFKKKFENSIEQIDHFIEGIDHLFEGIDLFLNELTLNKLVIERIDQEPKLHMDGVRCVLSFSLIVIPSGLQFS